MSRIFPRVKDIHRAESVWPMDVNRLALINLEVYHVKE